MNPSSNIYLSVIIPCYNASELLQQNLPILNEFLQQRSYNYEIILVDDGGNNKIPDSFESHPSIRFLHSGVNRGKGTAVKKGMLAAKGQFRLFTDADLPYELSVIDTILNYLDKKDMHMVAGDRTLQGSQYYGHISQNRELGSKLFRFIAGRFVTGGIHDTQCGIKGFQASTAKELFSRSRINGFAFDAEIYYLALKRNLDIKKIPVKLRSNQGKSVRLIKHGMGMIIDLFVIVANYYRGLYK
jgi:dolichyl-phosphate beta-glucosyltransferase